MTRLSVTSIAALTFIGAIVLGASGCHSQDAAPPQATAGAPVTPAPSLRAKGESKMRAEAAAAQAGTAQPTQ